MCKSLNRACVVLFMIMTIAVLVPIAPGCKGPSGNTIYEVASRGISRKRAQSLINQGQDVNERNPANGWTPLHVAVVNGHIKMVKFLLENGAEVNAQANDGSTPLHLAMAGRHDTVAGVLMMYGADKSIRNNLGEVPGDRR